MPFHFCTDELLAILALIPFIGLFFRRIHTWYHAKFHHKCHEEGCGAEHVEHCHMPADIPHGKVGESQCEQHPLASEKLGDAVAYLQSEPFTKAIDEYRLTHKGLVAGAIITYGPMTHEEIIAIHPNESPDEIHYAINEMVENGQLILDGNLLKEGNLFK